MREIFIVERTVHMIDDIELLRLIENNARLSFEEIAVMLGTTAGDVEAEIKRLKDENIILGLQHDNQLGETGSGQLHRHDRSKDRAYQEQGL